MGQRVKEVGGYFKPDLEVKDDEGPWVSGSVKNIDIATAKNASGLPYNGDHGDAAITAHEARYAVHYKEDREELLSLEYEELERVADGYPDEVVLPLEHAELDEKKGDRAMVRAKYCVVVLLAVFLLTVAKNVAGSSCSIPVEIVKNSIAGLQEEPLASELIKCTPIEMRVLTIEAYLVEVAVQVPRLQSVFLFLNGEWKLLSVSKQLEDGWEILLSEALNGTLDTPTNPEEASEVSGDFCRLLVDDNPDFGVVLDSVDSIPTDYESSDVYRDLLRAGQTKSQIRRRLLIGSPSDISTPRVVQDSEGASLSFFTWSYFGGAVTRWKVSFGCGFTIIKKPLASHVGSYDIYH